MRIVLLISILITLQASAALAGSTECYGKMDGADVRIASTVQIHTSKIGDVIVGENAEGVVTKGSVRLGEKDLPEPQVIVAMAPVVDKSIVDTIDVCEDQAGFTGDVWMPVAESKVELAILSDEIIPHREPMTCVDYASVRVTCK